MRASSVMKYTCTTKSARKVLIRELLHYARYLQHWPFGVARLCFQCSTPSAQYEPSSFPDPRKFYSFLRVLTENNTDRILSRQQGRTCFISENCRTVDSEMHLNSTPFKIGDTKFMAHQLLEKSLSQVPSPSP